MQILIALCAASMVCGLLVSYYYEKGRHQQRFVCKLLGSLLFFAAALVALALRAEAGRSVVWMMAAFLLGLVGDVLLALPAFLQEKYHSFFYMLGGGSFLLGHALFAAAFMQAGGFRFALLLLCPAVAALYLVLMALGAMRPAGMTAPVLGYGLALGVMLSGAAGLAAAGAPAGGFALGGACLFILSDTALFLFDYPGPGLQKARGALRFLDYALMLAYYAAQGLFAMAVLYL